MSKRYYDLKERYINLGKVRIGEILKNFGDYQNKYLLEYENESPSIINGCRSWLESKSKNKKVWILKFDTELGTFTDK